MSQIGYDKSDCVKNDKQKFVGQFGRMTLAKP